METKELELIEKIKTEVESLMKEKGLTSEQITEKLKTFTDVESVEKIKADLTAEITNLQEKIEKLKAGGDGQKTFKQNVSEAIKTKQAEIEAASKGSGSVSIYKVKTDNTPELTTAIVGATNPAPTLANLRNVKDSPQIRLRDMNITDYVSIGTSDTSTIEYADIIPVHNPANKGFADVVAEGNLKPRVAFTIEQRSVAEQVIAAHEILTKQAIRNVAQMESLATEYLLKRVMLKRGKHILDTVKTLVTGNTFDPASWTAPNVVQPNLYDVVVACINQIANTFSWTDDVQYLPNVAFVNWSDYMGLQTLKDKEENYLVKLNQLIPIVPMYKGDIAAGKILIGDFSLVEAYQTFAYEVSTGWVNDQFIRNKFTMLGETGLITFIKEYDKRAFIYDDIAAIKTALVGS